MEKLLDNELFDYSCKLISNYYRNTNNLEAKEVLSRKLGNMSVYMMMSFVADQAGIPPKKEYKITRWIKEIIKRNKCQSPSK